MKVSPLSYQLLPKAAETFEKSPQECFKSMVVIKTGGVFQYPFSIQPSKSGNQNIDSDYSIDDGSSQSSKQGSPLHSSHPPPGNASKSNQRASPSPVLHLCDIYLLRIPCLRMANQISKFVRITLHSNIHRVGAPCLGTLNHQTSKPGQTLLRDIPLMRPPHLTCQPHVSLTCQPRNSAS